MLSLSLSPFVVLNILASYVRFKRSGIRDISKLKERGSRVAWDIFGRKKADFDVDKKASRRRTNIYPALKLHLYFTEVTEDRLLYFLFTETCLS